MDAVEATPLVENKSRRGPRLTTKEKPSYTDPLPTNNKIVASKKRGWPKKENLAKKRISSNGSGPELEKVKKRTHNKKVKPSKHLKKKPKLDFSHRKPILEGMITEEVVEDKIALDPLIVSSKSSHNRVKETLRAFTSIYLHLVQEEQRRVQSIKVICAKKKSCKKAEDEEEDDEDLKTPSRRPDLKAISKMSNGETALNPIKRLGHVPGVRVGDQFFF